MAKKKYVAYYRVSTQKQGASGLGLEAQRETVLGYVNGVDNLVAEFTEVESGRKNERVQLQAALKHCRITGATLVVAKLDRLARDVAFTSSIMNSKTEFVCCDFPEANRLSLHIMAAVAEYEARATSERTKAAMKAAKARGMRFGNPNGAKALLAANVGNTAAVKVVKKQAESRASDLADMIADIQKTQDTLQSIADELTRRGAQTPRGGTWQPTTVKRLLTRLQQPAA